MAEYSSCRCTDVCTVTALSSRLRLTKIYSWCLLLILASMEFCSLMLDTNRVLLVSSCAHPRGGHVSQGAR